MVKKNSKGGKGYRKMGKKNSNIDTKTSLILREDGEEYVKVEKMLGNGRIYVLFPDGNKCIGIIPGRMRKKRFWIRVGDILLVSIRAYQEDRCDVIHRYSSDQVKTLKSQGDIVFNIDSCANSDPDKDDGLDFTDEVNGNSVLMGSNSSKPISDKLTTTINESVDSAPPDPSHVFSIDEI